MLPVGTQSRERTLLLCRCWVDSLDATHLAAFLAYLSSGCCGPRSNGFHPLYFNSRPFSLKLLTVQLMSKAQQLKPGVYIHPACRPALITSYSTTVCERGRGIGYGELLCPDCTCVFRTEAERKFHMLFACFGL
ncbi:hypothetical protein DL89DRAFT_171557 [Linderina pennispora]|uniref:Uncharacterized protein n=1 Tax=Linderina pennispora TaxID=61395 RepID=A0A1Y1W6F8_9FUNG|nr:uncharacterized protein DL89DRAFT_171557 [Linderina pennispora]ORX69101.1 hypothetical protein DL89DRAFT_171557 [Linderina pennispora]